MGSGRLHAILQHGSGFLATDKEKLCYKSRHIRHTRYSKAGDLCRKTHALSIAILGHQASRTQGSLRAYLTTTGMMGETQIWGSKWLLRRKQTAPRCFGSCPELSNSPQLQHSAVNELLGIFDMCLGTSAHTPTLTHWYKPQVWCK